MKPWYQKTLMCFGLSLMVVGFLFFAMVFPLGAPVVPWGGLVLAFVGTWVGFSKPTATELVKEQKPD